MLSPDYIVGLTDGEGSFSVYLHGPHKIGDYWTNYSRVECHYYIKLREDELPLLKKVKKFFNCGNLYLQKDKRRNHRNCYRFEVSSYRDIKEVVIPFFQKYPPQGVNRRNDFNLFCKIFKIATERKSKSLSEKEVNRIKKLKSQMHK
ncbi:MAG: LAGLIDADG family homing endonuclease [Patescibacteria group bacterium]|nr:LAGLIDADG family homing endonuclease [Patescibacteria group bacterium]